MIQKEHSQIYIIGAGTVGRMIAAELLEKKILGKVVAFIDDNPELIGKTLDGIPIYGPVSMIRLLKHGAFDEAIIAMPT
ncbi:MAG: nucleoside-diphosphate sugar epimerase/dehydratase, partial [Treponemataceae bacterium]